MMNIIKLFVLPLSLSIYCNPALAQSQTAGEKFESVTELNDMPADQMGKVMNLMSASLGVNCQYCHAGNDFAKEDVAHKSVSREMIAMTLKLNTDYFQGRTVITCNTCHRGKAKPESDIVLKSIAGHQRATAPNSPVESKQDSEPTVDQVLEKYVRALGGADRLAAIESRKITAKRLEPSGRSEPEQLWQASGGKSRLVTLYGDLAIAEICDGKLAWKLVGENEIQLKFDEAAQIRTEAAIGLGDLKSVFSNIRFDRNVRINDSETFQLDATAADSLKERLNFDSETGLLVRRTSTLNTVLGPFDYQVDYLDYQVFGGVKLPTKIEFNMPNVSWTRVITAVESNAAIDPKLFQR